MKLAAPILLIAVVAMALATSVAISATESSAAIVSSKRAHFNYQMFCQGCHGANGDSGRGVPLLREQVGMFLNSQAGREYLIRVPGAANAPLSDAQLAELINWTIAEFGGTSVPARWQAYTSTEIGRYRKEPLLEVTRYRQELLNILSAASKR